MTQPQLAGVGIVLSFFAVAVLARRDGASAAAPFATLGVAAFAAVAGGRLWSLLEWWASGGDVVWVLDPFQPAGYASAGAFVGAGAALTAARVVYGRTEFARIADAVVPAGLAALALTRLGCVFERCDPGRPATFFGVRYPDGAILHAFGAYIALPSLIWVLGVGLALRGGAPGRRAVAAALGYAAIRFFAEFFRDAPTLLHPGHLVSVAVGLAAVAWWHFDARSRAPA